MKLIQLNTWMGRLSRAIVRYIEEEKPDILCLQEVFKSNAPVAYPEDRMFDLYGLIKETGLFNYAFFSPLVQMDIADGTADFGNAIFSKYPILSQEVIFTDGEKVVEHFTTRENGDCNPARNAQFVVLDIEGQKLAVVNQHFHWSKNPLGDENSVVRMRLVAEKAREYADLPLLISGDFNLKYESPAMRVFDGWLRDVVAEKDVTTTLSGLKFAKEEVQVVCDHILVNDKIKVHETIINEVMISDHLPVKIEFEI